MSMRIPSMFKTPRHRTFDYKPIIYDELKEKKRKFEELVEEQKKGELSDEVRQARIRKILGHRMSDPRFNRKRQSLNQMMRFIAIMAVLFGLVWFLLS
jgi:predicted transcriptional regulator